MALALPRLGFHRMLVEVIIVVCIGLLLGLCMYLVLT